MTKKTLTVSEVAKLLHVSNSKVLAWIRKGDLTGFDVSLTDRPLYRITEESLTDFIRRRTVVPMLPVRRRRKLINPIISAEFNFE